MGVVLKRPSISSPAGALRGRIRAPRAGSGITNALIDSERIRSGGVEQLSMFSCPPWIVGGAGRAAPHGTEIAVRREAVQMSGESAVTARKLHNADVVYLYDGNFEGFLCRGLRELCPARDPLRGLDAERRRPPLPVQILLPPTTKGPACLCELCRKGAETEYLVTRTFRPGVTRNCSSSGFCIWPLCWGRAPSSGRATRSGPALREMKKSLDWEVDKVSRALSALEEHDGMLGAVIHPKTTSRRHRGAFRGPLPGGELDDLRCSAPSGVTVSGP